MKILHLSTFETGTGASRGSQWLHDALRRRGVQSEMLVGIKQSKRRSVHTLPGALSQFGVKVRMRLDRLPMRRYRTTDESFWSLGWMPARFDKLTAHLAPDIVHLHWVGAGFLPISAFRQFNCPIVWTLRDMWSFSGGCHYSAGCERYRQKCGACPQLNSTSEQDLSRFIWRYKQQQWRDLPLWLVPISHWLGDCARDSGLLAKYPIEVIPNGLDIAIFRPIEKRAARQAWGLPADRPIVVYGAIAATRDPRKGFGELQQALRVLSSRPKAKDILLVVFGDTKIEDFPDLGIEMRHVGFIADNHRLAELYSGADVAVMPSLQEAFGKTLIEAMACGTPVVAFASGGPLDIIEHRLDGYLAQAFSPEDLAEGIVWCLEAQERGGKLGRIARAKVERDFDIDVVAGRYQSLYERILIEHREGPPTALSIGPPLRETG